MAVHWTFRRHVSKERGAPAGQVSLRQYQSIKAAPAIPPGVVALDGTDDSAGF